MVFRSYEEPRQQPLARAKRRSPFVSLPRRSWLGFVTSRCCFAPSSVAQHHGPQPSAFCGKSGSSLFTLGFGRLRAGNGSTGNIDVSSRPGFWAVRCLSVSPARAVICPTVFGMQSSFNRDRETDVRCLSAAHAPRAAARGGGLSCWRAHQMGDLNGDPWKRPSPSRFYLRESWERLVPPISGQKSPVKLPGVDANFPVGPQPMVVRAVRPGRGVMEPLPRLIPWRPSHPPQPRADRTAGWTCGEWARSTRVAPRWRSCWSASLRPRTRTLTRTSSLTFEEFSTQALERLAGLPASRGERNAAEACAAFSGAWRANY